MSYSSLTFLSSLQQSDNSDNLPQGTGDFPPEPHVRRKKRQKPAHYWGRGGVSWKEISHSPDGLSDHLVGETGAEAVMFGDGQDHTVARTAWVHILLATCLNFVAQR